MDPNNSKTAIENGGNQNWLEIVREQVNSLRYGVVEIVVHESRVVQIERTERVRLDRSPPDPRQARKS